MFEITRHLPLAALVRPIPPPFNRLSWDFEYFSGVDIFQGEYFQGWIFFRGGYLSEVKVFQGWIFVFGRGHFQAWISEFHTVLILGLVLSPNGPNSYWWKFDNSQYIYLLGVLAKHSIMVRASIRLSLFCFSSWSTPSSSARTGNTTNAITINIADNKRVFMWKFGNRGPSRSSTVTNRAAKWPFYLPAEFELSAFQKNIEKIYDYITITPWQLPNTMTHWHATVIGVKCLKKQSKEEFSFTLEMFFLGTFSVRIITYTIIIIIRQE